MTVILDSAAGQKGASGDECVASTACAGCPAEAMISVFLLNDGWGQSMLESDASKRTKT